VVPAAKVIAPKSAPEASFRAEKVMAVEATVNPAYEPVMVDVAFIAVVFTGILGILLLFK